MKNYFKALDRGEVTTFSRNSYEVIFAVFMIALAYFYRGNPQIVYPRILYFFLLLLGSNFLFNYLLRRRAAVNLWLIDLILLVNFWVITGVLYYSGRGGSYFWVLYLLPVFAASLMASFKDSAGMVLLCVLSITIMAWPVAAGDLAGALALAVKIGVLTFSAGVVYSTAQSRKRAEAGLAFKREQVELLEKKVTDTESEIVKTASAGEVGTLVSGVMHDLGNAVSVILLSAELAVAAEKPEKRDLERVLKGARYAKGLLAAALSIVRGQEYTFESVQLREPVEGAVLLTDYTARKKNAPVELDLPEGLPPLRMSRAHMERVFINALSNSLSFVPNGGKVRISARAEGDLVITEIYDSGPGFPEKMLKEGIKAFGTTRKEKGGTGLGLFVCDQIVRRHGGEMRLDNPPGGGAKVTISLPAGGPAESSGK
ncbi:MAG: HAMP domain-containing sensor histidine kinase [Elusimicrobiota bacterium]|nr:HAMP domain-containing sensor histidine kinase [Elusimicrobiota bacterium]